MTHRIFSAASFVVFVSLAAPNYAVELAFNVALITESRTYERMEVRKGSSPGRPCAALYCGAAQPVTVRVQIERVTVALEGERITGEWSALMSRWPGMLAKDFPLDTDVQAAVRGNELRLMHPDGTGWVRARIVDRERD